MSAIEGQNRRTPVKDELSSLLRDAHAIAVAHSGLKEDANTVRELVCTEKDDEG